MLQEEDEEVVWMTDTSEAAVAARAAEQLSQATSEMVTQGNLEVSFADATKKGWSQQAESVCGPVPMRSRTCDQQCQDCACTCPLVS